MPRKKKETQENPTNEADASSSLAVSDEIPKAVDPPALPPPPPPASETGTDASSIDENEWSSDVEAILRNIQSNCSVMSKHHKKRYLSLKGKLIYFRIPLIVLGSANSVFAVGLVQYLPQQDVSVINCMLSLVCAIITSVELFLGIQSGMERELVAQREFYLMAVDLYSALSLERHHRTVNGKRYLEKILSQYNKLIENSDVVRAKITDHLLPVIPNAEDPEIIISAGSLDKNLGANI